MRKEINIFLTALTFYTRIPIPGWKGFEKEYFPLSIRYVPLIGAIVGAFTAVVYLLASEFFSHSISIALSMVGSIVLTGAFHEDGLADSADALGGGWQSEDVLNIMKDSRLGTYGTISLILSLGLKFLFLSEMSASMIVPVLIVVHAVSRVAPVILAYSSEYIVQINSKAGALASGVKISSVICALIFSLIGILLLGYNNGWEFLIIFAPLIPVTFFMRIYFIQRIGGVTGDILGASQQVSELILYMGVLVVCRFI